MSYPDGNLPHMTEELDVRSFAIEFRAFLKAINELLPEREPSWLSVRLTAHLGVNPGSLPVVTETLPPYEHANVQAALDAYLARPGVSGELLGIAGGGREHQGLADLITAIRFGSYDVGAVDYATLSVGVGKEAACVSFGLYLISDGDDRLAALVRHSTHRGMPELLIEVLGADPETTRQFLRTIRELAIVHHVGRGQVLSFESYEYGHGIGPLRFHERPHVNAADVILPAGVLDSVHR